MRRLHVALLLLSMNSAGCVEEVSYAPPAELAITLPIASFAVRNGASFVLPVVATRGPGMAGAIEVEVKQLPTGLTAAPAVIAPGATAARISLRADNAPTGFDVRFELEARDAAGRLARASAKVLVLGIEGQLISGSSAQRMHPRAAPRAMARRGSCCSASPPRASWTARMARTAPRFARAS